jgi:hypothetical protein
MSPSVHILIATIGKKSLLRMLNSLRDQLTNTDFITVVFDAKDVGNIYKQVHSMLETNFKCTHTLIYEKKNLGYWGHGIRNKHNKLHGEYIMHADDDDVYVGNAISVVKQAVQPDFINFFRIKNGKGQLYWATKDVRIGNVSTQCAVIPAQFNANAKWAPFYGGDGKFFVDLCAKHPYIWHDKVIYLMRDAK